MMLLTAPCCASESKQESVDKGASPEEGRPSSYRNTTRMRIELRGDEDCFHGVEYAMHTSSFHESWAKMNILEHRLQSKTTKRMTQKSTRHHLPRKTFLRKRCWQPSHLPINDQRTGCQAKCRGKCWVLRAARASQS